MNRKQWAIAQAAALEEAARDQGRDLHRLHSELLLVEVARLAMAAHPDSKALAIAYVEGYQAARAQRDAYLQEGNR